MKRLLFIITVFLISQNAYSQREAVNWYFGFGAGMTFKNGTPEPLYDGLMNTEEGCATISDNKGNLLFYTNGVSVWNKNHNYMKNGQKLMGHSSSTQSGIIIPKPGYDNLYYIFTVDAHGGDNGFRYTMVNTAADAGRGEVNVSYKNELLQKSSTEKVSAVKHANGDYYWIIMHEFDSDKFHVYLVDDSKQMEPKEVGEFAIGIVHERTGETDEPNSRGYMKSSPDGTKLAVAIDGQGTIEVFDFNYITGELSNVKTYNQPEYARVYGVEFSPDSKFLYFSTLEPSRIFQLELATDNVIKIWEDEEDFKTCAMQLGPDAKIYVASQVDDIYLGVIDSPNIADTACHYKHKEVEFGMEGHIGVKGLPTFIQSFFKPTIGIVSNSPVCEGHTLFLSTAATEGATYSWTGPDNWTSSLREPYIENVSLAASGEYYLEVTVIGSTSYDTVAVQIDDAPYVEMNSSVDIINDTIWFCDNDPAQLTANTDGESYDAIRWTLDGDDYEVETETISLDKSGFVVVTAENNNGCDYKDSLYAVAYPAPRIVMFADGAEVDTKASKCQGEITLNAWTDAVDKSLVWSGGETTDTIIVTESGDYTVTITDTNGCTSVHTVYCHIGSPEPVIPGNHRMCPGQSITLTTEFEYASYEWQPGGETTRSIEVNQPGDYTVKVIDDQGCEGDVTVTVEEIDFDEYFADIIGLDFYKVHFGTEAIKNIDMKNEGLDDIRIETIKIEGAPDGIYELSDEGPISFYNGENADFDIHFKPDQIRIYEAKIIIQLSEPCSYTYEQTIKGIGSAEVLFTLPDLVDTVGTEDFCVPLHAMILADEGREYNLSWNNIDLSFDGAAFAPAESADYDLAYDEGKFTLTLHAGSQNLTGDSSLIANICGTLMFHDDGTPLKVSRIDLTEDVIDTVKRDGSLSYLGLCRPDMAKVQYFDTLAVSAIPNPAGSSTDINFSSNEPGRYTLEIYSVQGALVYSEEFYNQEKQKLDIRRSLDLKDIPSGVYRVIVRTTYQRKTQPLIIFK